MPRLETLWNIDVRTRRTSLPLPRRAQALDGAPLRMPKARVFRVATPAFDLTYKALLRRKSSDCRTPTTSKSPPCRGWRDDGAPAANASRSRRQLPIVAHVAMQGFQVLNRNAAAARAQRLAAGGVIFLKRGVSRLRSTVIAASCPRPFQGGVPARAAAQAAVAACCGGPR